MIGEVTIASTSEMGEDLTGTEENIFRLLFLSIAASDPVRPGKYRDFPSIRRFCYVRGCSQQLRVYLGCTFDLDC